jgi:hypothetical protein
MRIALPGASRRMAMDRHEKGLEKIPGRPDQPLPEWKGSYAGDAQRLPKVVQKLLHDRILTAEEKAELLWRLFELDQKARSRRASARRILIAVVLIATTAWVAIYQWRWVADQVMAWLSPPAAPPA